MAFLYNVDGYGMQYSKTTWGKLGLTEPKSWEEFLDL